MTLRSMYFILAIAGAIIPYGFFISFGIDYGLDPGVFLTAPFANAAAGGFTADLLMSSIVFWLYVFSRVGDNGPAPCLPISGPVAARLRALGVLISSPVRGGD